MRCSKPVLAFFLASQLLATTQPASAQILDRLKTRNGRQSNTSRELPRLVPQPLPPDANSPAFGPTLVPPENNKPADAALPRIEPIQLKSALPMTSKGVQPSDIHEKPPTRTVASTPLISVETTGPSEINVGRRAVFTITVRNQGQSVVESLTVQATIPSGTELVATDPKPLIQDDILQYNLVSLAAKAERQIKIELIPREPGLVDLRAQVIHTTAVSVPLEVRRPEVAVEITGPEEAIRGDVVTFKAVITNTGDGVVEDIRVSELLPRWPSDEEIAQAEAAVGQVTDRIARLLPGESTEVALRAVARSEGKLQAGVLVKADDGIEARASADIRVLSPAIELKIVGPESRNVHRAAGYLVTVTNTGNAPAENIVITASLPQGMEIGGVEKSETVDKRPRLLMWKLTRLEPGQTEPLKFQARTIAEGEQRIQVALTGDRGLAAEALLTTQVKGMAALALVVQDNPGPIETGEPARYELLVKNCGTKVARNISVKGQLPSGISVVEAPGHKTCGASVEFNSIDRLNVNEELVLEVVVTCKEPGDRTVRFSLTSDALEQEITAETSTLFFAPNRPESPGR